MPPRGWTQADDVALVRELVKREYLHATWLPHSQEDHVRCSGAYDEEGIWRSSETLLRRISEAVFGQDDAKDSGLLRTRLTRLFDIYFQELEVLNINGAPHRHIIPVDKLFDGSYKTRREKLDTKRPWWNEMHAVMVEHIADHYLKSPSNGDYPKALKRDDDCGDTSTSLAAVSRIGTKSGSSIKAEATDLRYENEQLRKDLQLERQKVKILCLERKVSMLEAQKVTEERDSDGEDE